MDWVHEIGFSGTCRNQLKNGFKGKLKKVFFLQIFAIMNYLMIFQSFAEPSVCSTLKNDQIWQKFGNIGRKAYFKNPFVSWQFQNPKPEYCFGQTCFCQWVRMSCFDELPDVNP